MTGHRGLALLTAVGLLAGLMSLPTGAALAGGSAYLWPTACGGGTLQHCIDSTVEGDSIQIDTNAAVPESITISHSLMLSLAPGYHGTLQGIDVNAAQAVGVSLHDLVIDGTVTALLEGDSSNTLSITNISVSDSIAEGAAISVQTDTSATISITGNRVRMLGHQADGIDVRDAALPGDVTLDVIGNRISGRGNTAAGVGIMLYTPGNGSLIANVDNNAVLSAATCFCGADTAVIVDAAGTATQTYNVVGDTVDRSGGSGITIENQVSDTTHVNLFNNLVTNGSRWGLFVYEYGTAPATWHAGDNDIYHNGNPDQLAGHPAGSGNLSVAPTYVDAVHGDVTLTASSPVIDKGVVCSPGGVAMRDAAGDARLHGSSVDIGAYERGASAPTGVALVGDGTDNFLIGTSGADILCGMGGADIVEGNGGNDYVDGGSGKDELFGGSGADLLFGRSGNDMLCTVDGKHGNDHLDGGSGTDGYLADSGDIRTSVEHPADCKQP